MRKAERLFQIVTFLRGKRSVVTAQQLAERLQVSERTIYRDVQALSLSGVPIESEAGIGYRLKSDFSIPPIMFEQDELEALLLGMKMVQGWSNQHMAAAADSAMAKIHSVLPDKLHRDISSQPDWLFVPSYQNKGYQEVNNQLSQAVKDKIVVELFYQDEKANQTTRKVWPLGMIYWGKTWTLVAWCTKRQDYRMFRLDRIQSLVMLEQGFETTDEISLQTYINFVRKEYGEDAL